MSDAIQRTVRLNGTDFPIIGKVARRRISPWPPQFKAGPMEADDGTTTRKQQWAALKGGMGLLEWEAGADDRYWEADAVDASRNDIVLGPKVTTLGTFGTEVDFLEWWNGRLWAIGHNAISYWSGSAWVSVKTDLPNPTSVEAFYGA